MKYWISDTSSEAIALKISFSDGYIRKIRNSNGTGWKCSKFDSVLGYRSKESWLCDSYDNIQQNSHF